MKQKLKEYAITELLNNGLLGYFGNDDIIESSRSNIVVYIREHRESDNLKSISYAACLLYCEFEIDYNNLTISFKYVDGYLYDDYWMGILDYDYITCSAKANIFDVMNVEVSTSQYCRACACYMKERRYIDYLTLGDTEYNKIKYIDPLSIISRNALDEKFGVLIFKGRPVTSFGAPLYKYLPADKDTSDSLISYLKKRVSEETRVYLSEAILYDCILYYRIMIYASDKAYNELSKLHKDIIISKTGISGFIEIVIPKGIDILEGKIINEWN